MSDDVKEDEYVRGWIRIRGQRQPTDPDIGMAIAEAVVWQASMRDEIEVNMLREENLRLREALKMARMDLQVAIGEINRELAFVPSKGEPV